MGILSMGKDVMTRAKAEMGRKEPPAEDVPNVLLEDLDTPLKTSELLESIVQWAVELLQSDAGEIYLWDPQRAELVLSISHGFVEVYDGIGLQPGEGMAGRILQSGEPMIIDNYDAWEGKAEVFVPTASFYANLGVPMKWRGQTIGVLALDADSRKRVFGQDDVRLATLFANVATVAIENARLYERLQERSERLQHTLEQEVAQRTAELAHRALQLETSAHVSREITSILDIDQLLTRVVELISKAFGLYHVQVFLVDPGEDSLILRASSSDVSPRFHRLEIGPGSLNGRVAQTNEPLLANDVSRDPRFLADELLPDVRSELVVPLLVGERAVGTLDVQSALLNAFSEEDMLVFQSLGNQIAIAIQNARLYERSREMAVLEERNRMARELHDSVTQSLFSIDLHARAIATLQKRDLQRAEENVQQLRQITHDTLQEMRSLIFDLRASALEDIGLVPALRQQMQRWRRPDGPELVLRAIGERRLPAEVERGLYRIAQEAIRNAVKHAGAGRIEAVLAMGSEQVALSVTDDGRGFDQASLPADRRAFGLIGMKERAQLLNGSIEIVSQPGAGTRVKVRVPA